MKIGISTACLSNFSETEDALLKLNEIGADVSEVFLRTFYEYRPEFAKKFAVNAQGVEINSVCVNAENFESQLFSPSRRERGDGFYWLDQVMRGAQLFGAKNYTFHGMALKGCNYNDFDDWAAHMREISAFCARYGVRLCLKNSCRTIYSGAGVFTELKNRCSELWGVFDNLQARKSGYPYPMYLKDMCGSISHVRLSDVDQDGKIRLPGEGVTDFKEMFERLKDAGFDGAAVIYAAGFEDLSSLKRSVEFLKEIACAVK